MYVHERQYATVCSQVLCVRVWVCVCVYAPRVRLRRSTQRSGFYELRFGKQNKNCCFRVRMSSPNFRIFVFFGGGFRLFEPGCGSKFGPALSVTCPLCPHVWPVRKILIFFEPIFEKYRGFLIFGVLKLPANPNSAPIPSVAFVPRSLAQNYYFFGHILEKFSHFFRLR